MKKRTVAAVVAALILVCLLVTVSCSKKPAEAKEPSWRMERMTRTDEAGAEQPDGFRYTFSSLSGVWKPAAEEPEEGEQQTEPEGIPFVFDIVFDSTAVYENMGFWFVISGVGDTVMPAEGDFLLLYLSDGMGSEFFFPVNVQLVTNDGFAVFVYASDIDYSSMYWYFAEVIEGTVTYRLYDEDNNYYELGTITTVADGQTEVISGTGLLGFFDLIMNDVLGPYTKLMDLGRYQEALDAFRQDFEPLLEDTLEYEAGLQCIVEPCEDALKTE